MIFPDPWTVIFTSAVTDIICTLVITQLWRNSRERFAGTNFWVADFGFQTMALLLIIMRGIIPDWISIVLANALVVAGALMGLVGLELFLGKRGPRVRNYCLLAVFCSVHVYFTFFQPSLSARNLNLSVVLLILCLQCAWLMLHRAERSIRPMTRAVGFVFGAYCLVSLSRVAEILIFPQFTNDFFKSGGIDMMFLVTYQMLFILLTYGLALMVNGFLFTDLRTQEEKFSSAFHSSPYAIMLTSLHDGTIFEVNEAFEKITGYPTSEVLGKTSLDLNLWLDAHDRAALVGELAEKGSVRDIELKLKMKNGEIRTGLLSADVIMVNDRPVILSSISDITGRKIADERVNSLLRENELLLKETHHRIKNNMSVIQSLLSLHAEAQDYEACRNVLNDAANRIQSMAVLYDKLYRSDIHQELGSAAFLPPLIDEIVGVFHMIPPVKTIFEIEDFPLNLEILLPIGIILTELITNSMKYAFRDTGSGIIAVSATKAGTAITIKYGDNGIGLPETVTVENSTGFGMQLIRILVQQINGSLTIERNNGTKYVIKCKA